MQDDATLETIMVRGVKNGLRDINESTEFLHHNPNECKVMFNFTRHRVPQLEASWEAYWKKTYDVVFTTKKAAPNRDQYASEEEYVRDLADYNKYPDAGPGDVIPVCFEKTRRMGNCIECGAAST